MLRSEEGMCSMKAHTSLPNVTLRFGGDARRDAQAGTGPRAIAARMVAVSALVLFSLFVFSFFVATVAPVVGHHVATTWMYTALAHHGAG
jgi:hypothetical protein